MHVDDLAALNATLNATSAVLLTIGWFLIKRATAFARTAAA